MLKSDEVALHCKHAQASRFLTIALTFQQKKKYSLTKKKDLILPKLVTRLGGTVPTRKHFARENLLILQNNL